MGRIVGVSVLGGSYLARGPRAGDRCKERVREGGEGIRAISPGEDGFETPGADEGFGFGAGGHGGVVRKYRIGRWVVLILQMEGFYVGWMQHL